MLKHYISLTKPGIISGNLIATAAGFFLAAKGDIDWQLLIFTLLGVTLIVGSGCAFNNYIDRDIDGKMERTKNRALVKGMLSTKSALIFATIIGILGFSALVFFTNAWATGMSVVGFLVYVGLYSLMLKRTSVYGTAIGSISGACPPVIGYLAITAQFDMGAAILLVAFCLWQMPHSYAIAIYRFSDYQRANIPVLPLTDGIKAARYHIIAYIIAFILVCLLLVQQNYVGMVYAVVMSVLGIYWVYIALMEYSEKNQIAWGKKLFLLSIVIICCFSTLISLDFVADSSLITASN